MLAVPSALRCALCEYGISGWSRSDDFAFVLSSYCSIRCSGLSRNKVALGIGSPKKEGNLCKYTRSNGFFPIQDKHPSFEREVDLPSQQKERDTHYSESNQEISFLRSLAGTSSLFQNILSPENEFLDQIYATGASFLQPLPLLSSLWALWKAPAFSIVVSISISVLLTCLRPTYGTKKARYARVAESLFFLVPLGRLIWAFLNQSVKVVSELQTRPGWSCKKPIRFPGRSEIRFAIARGVGNPLKMDDITKIRSKLLYALYA